MNHKALIWIALIIGSWVLAIGLCYAAIHVGAAIMSAVAGVM